MPAFVSVLIQCIVITKSTQKLEEINTNSVNIQHLTFSVNNNNKTLLFFHDKPVKTTATATKTKTTILKASMLKNTQSSCTLSRRKSNSKELIGFLQVEETGFKGGLKMPVVLALFMRRGSVLQRERPE